MRSKTNWYEYGEKSTKYFLNLEKHNSVKNTIRNIFIDKDGTEKLSCNDKDILDQAKTFYVNLFSRKSVKTIEDCSNFMNNIPIPTLSDENKLLCDSFLTADEMSESLTSMASNKSPGNDGLTVEFYKNFWSILKTPLFRSTEHAKINGSLSVSQRQAVIKLLEKKDKDKRYIQNWRPISLLNVDTKIISKALAYRLKKVLPEIINYDQTAYIHGRYIGESTRLIYDILESTDLFNISGYIMTADVEKAFDSMDHTFLIATLRKFGFGEYFIDWIKALLNNNESCVINGGSTSQYFKLQRGARQGDPIAAYLFIICLEVFFIMIRNNKDIHSLNIFEYDFLLSAYADDTTFFVRDTNSITVIISTFKKFSLFSGFKLNLSKCEICGIGTLKGAKVALCGLKNVDLSTSSIKILGFHYSYNTELASDKNFVSVIKKIITTLRIWKLRKLTLQGKITIFKTLAISKIIYIASIATIPINLTRELEKIHKDFIWDSKTPKIKHTTLIGDFNKGGLRDIDISSKFSSLQLSWLNRYFDSNFHPWKIFAKHYFSMAGEHIFFPNSSLSTNSINIPLFYKTILNLWHEISQQEPLSASSILSECVWYNTNILIDNKCISPNIFSHKIKSALFVGDFFNQGGSKKTWHDFRKIHNLDNTHFFQWQQIYHAIPENYKKIINADNGLSRSLCHYEPHILSNAKITPMLKLKSKEFYIILIRFIYKEPSSQKTLLKKLNVDSLPWKKIYVLPRNLSIDAYSRIFQFKCFHNILYLNNTLHKCGITESPLCSYCNLDKETLVHLFCECKQTQSLWKRIQDKFQPNTYLPNIDPQSAFFGFIDGDFFQNHVLLIFKLSLYRLRGKPLPSLDYIIKYLREREYLERSHALTLGNIVHHNNKWQLLVA